MKYASENFNLQNLSPGGVPILRPLDILLPLFVHHHAGADNEHSGYDSDRHADFLPAANSAG